ncbi:hypothetical protein CleRT_09390 [Candidatus Coxiella mudrowiae]|uniref:Uncharacterized protein n=1 Tax=Candidatus Coxiella mudrowiae TaxID=2054173 RepID=A0ABN4HPN5_9COXI|nr:hypothetical protein CleRT_09390 [Candidatus Coxiella mudrowiae]
MEFITRVFENLSDKKAWEEEFIYNILKFTSEASEALFPIFNNIINRSVADTYITYDILQMYSEKISRKPTFDSIGIVVGLPALAIAITMLS